MRSTKRPWKYTFALLIFLAGCKLSPHGGIVPIWYDAADDVKYRGGNGSSFKSAVRIENVWFDEAGFYECHWFCSRKEYKFGEEEYKRHEERVNGRIYHVVEVPGPEPRRQVYFDLSDLKTRYVPPNR